MQRVVVSKRNLRLDVLGSGRVESIANDQVEVPSRSGERLSERPFCDPADLIRLRGVPFDPRRKFGFRDDVEFRTLGRWVGVCSSGLFVWMCFEWAYQRSVARSCGHRELVITKSAR